MCHVFIRVKYMQKNVKLANEMKSNKMGIYVRQISVGMLAVFLVCVTFTLKDKHKASRHGLIK